MNCTRAAGFRAWDGIVCTRGTWSWSERGERSWRFDGRLLFQVRKVDRLGRLSGIRDPKRGWVSRTFALSLASFESLRRAGGSGMPNP